jgi:AmmeMemoRadiSam system protein B
MVRQPAVAGQFYPGNGKELRAEISGLVPSAGGGEKALGIIAPHAGYIYSGHVAGKIYGEVAVPERVIILGPNHHGIGARASLYPDGEWITPLGTSRIDSLLSRLVKKHAPQVEEDTVAHLHEHSLEVQLPFLQFIRPDVSIVPLCLGFADYASCAALGKGLAGAIRESGEEALIVASSDMTHYESAASARVKDDEALKEVLALNPEGLLKVCRSMGITMCGVIPSTVMLVAALELGASKARLVSYATSGDVTGDNRQVVAYAAVSVS